MISGRRVFLGGWMLAELVVAMAILAILTPTVGSLVRAALRTTYAVSERTERNSALAAAQAASLELARRGFSPGEIARELEPRFPDLTFTVDGPVCRIEYRTSQRVEAPHP